MKRGLWLLMFFLLAGHVPAASADSACEGRFVNPITDICWSCIFPLSLGSIKVSQGKVPDTANPSMPIQICPAPPPLFRRIGLAIGYWEPMALTDVTRSFSFINSEQLQRFVKQIMSNAAGYFFDLALQTTVPEIKTAKDFLQKMASDINSMNLSSCQAAQGIIGGLFPRTQVSQQKVCQDIAGESNIFADWAASRQGCTVGGKSDSVRDKASDKDKERVTKNINIMWNALSKNRMFDGNKELKEFVMTLTGSLVFGPNGEITPLSARTTDRSIIRAMMEGGTAKIYHCNDSDKCLKVVADTPVTISRDNALKSQITKLLASIQNKAVSDTPLDDKEKGFISSTTIPVFKYLVDPQMLGVSNSMIYQLTDYIGYDILLQYIQELIQQARAMVATGNYDEAVIEHINDNMNDATRQIAAFQSQVQVQQDALLVVDRQMSYMRQQLSARMLSRYQNNYHFGGSTL
ncbi:conjugal transfer pilus assembly protein TraH [Escherichia coli]